MLDETGRFKIPKLNVPVVCKTIVGETVVGEIFLDLSSPRERYTTRQILDFFNHEPSFFPLRTPASPRPVLFRKQAIVRTTFPEIAKHLEDETSLTLAKKKDAVLYFSAQESVTATLVLDLPEESSRILDLLGQHSPFFPALIEDNYAVVNSLHIYKIEEL